MVRNNADLYIQFLKTPRDQWKGELAKLPEGEDTEQLKAWLRNLWPQKGVWEELAKRKAEQRIRDAAMRKHEKIVTDTKRRRK